MGVWARQIAVFFVCVYHLHFGLIHRKFVCVFYIRWCENLWKIRPWANNIKSLSIVKQGEKDIPQRIINIFLKFDSIKNRSGKMNKMKWKMNSNIYTNMYIYKKWNKSKRILKAIHFTSSRNNRTMAGCSSHHTHRVRVGVYVTKFYRLH